MNIVSGLFKLARLGADVNAVAKGKPWPRVKNKVVGRTLARGGFWKWLWG